MRQMVMRACAVIPTYNEAPSIVPLAREVIEQIRDIVALVVDDNSPDGTAALVERESAATPRVQLLLRTNQRGRGSAGAEGFRRALEWGAERIIEMDGDGSHDPAYIPALLQAAGSADLVIGSRFIPGGRDEERSRVRRAVSSCARRYLRAVLGVKVQDPTSGFRCYTRKALMAITEEPLRARDPFIVAETLYRCSRRGLRIVEVPISFRDRKAGRSKLLPATLVAYLIRAVRLRSTGRC
jgi:dolichol-phosphate mannosyltransferase